MPAALKFGFTPLARPRGVLIVFCEENLKFGPATQRTLAPLGDLVRRAAAADRFTGKEGSSLDIVAPTGLNLPRVVAIGVGKESELKSRDIVKRGGAATDSISTRPSAKTMTRSRPRSRSISPAPDLPRSKKPGRNLRRSVK